MRSCSQPFTSTGMRRTKRMWRSWTSYGLLCIQPDCTYPHGTVLALSLPTAWQNITLNVPWIDDYQMSSWKRVSMLMAEEDSSCSKWDVLVSQYTNMTSIQLTHMLLLSCP